MKAISTSRAIYIGLLWVNAPVFLLLFGPVYLTLTYFPKNNSLILLVAFLGFVAAWGYWAVSVPRWRVWALERVESPGELQSKAVAAGLVWPEGSFFGRTEITNAKLRAKTEALTRHRT